MTRHFFDVGANIGQTFDDYLDKQPNYAGWTVWCFEPSPRHISALTQRAEAASQRYTINVCPFGLGGETSIQTFYTKDDPRGDSFLHKFSSDHEPVNLVTGYRLVQCTYALTEFIAACTGSDDEIVLKLDVEGSEYAILNKLHQNPDVMRRVKRLFVEFHVVPPLPAGMLGSEITDLYRLLGKPIEPWMF